MRATSDVSAGIARRRRLSDAQIANQHAEAEANRTSHTAYPSRPGPYWRSAPDNPSTWKRNSSRRNRAASSRASQDQRGTEIEDPVRDGVHGKDRVVEHRAAKGADLQLQRFPFSGARRLDHADGLLPNGCRIPRKHVRRGKRGGNERKQEQEEERETRPRPPGSVGNPSSHNRIC
jgi:hypothetical protein